MAFDPDKYLAEKPIEAKAPRGGFDPDAYLGKKEPKETQKAKESSIGSIPWIMENLKGVTPESAQAALEHYGNAATFGNLGAIQAGAAKLLPGGPTDFAAEKLRNEQRIARQGEESPKASLAGTVGGIGANMLLTGAAGKALELPGQATRLGRIATATGSGGVMGGLQRPEEEDTLSNRAVGAAKGAALGGLTQGAIEGISAAAKPVSKFFSDRAAKKAVKALGGTKTEIQNLQKTGQEISVGRELLDSDLIPIFGSPKRIQGRIEGAKEEVGKEIGGIIKKFGDEKVIDTGKLAEEIAAKPVFASLRTTPGAEGLADRAEKTLDTLRLKGDLSLKEAQELRQNVDKLINFSKTSDELRGIQPILYEIRSGIRDSMTSVAKDLKSPNSKFSLLSKAEKMVEGKTAREAANRALGLTDTISGGAGATIGTLIAGPAGAVPGAVIGAGVNKLGRTYGSAASARGYDAIAKLVAKTPSLTAFAENNPVRFQALVNQISTPSVKLNADDSQFPVLQDPEMLAIFKSNPELLNNVKNPILRRKIEIKSGLGK